MIQTSDYQMEEREYVLCRQEAGTVIEWSKRMASRVREWEGPVVQDGALRHRAFEVNTKLVANIDKQLLKSLESLNHSKVKQPLVKFVGAFWKHAMMVDELDIAQERSVALTMLRFENTSDLGKAWRDSGREDNVAEQELRRRGIIK